MSNIEPIVSSAWLFQHLDNPQIIIIDCRFQLSDPQWGYRQYLGSHLKGAFYLDLEQDLSGPLDKHGGRHPLPNPELVAQKLSAIGINWGETLVVAYDDSRFAFAARLWWLLRYLGHEKVVLLDGGWPGWQASGYPVTAKIPTPKEGQFIPHPQQEWLVDLETVKASQVSPSIVLVDSRDRDRYLGEREPIDPIAGHIPGAVNSPWQAVTHETGFLKPYAEQQQLWANYQDADEIIFYCGSGVTACVNFFSYQLVTSKSKARLYPGGWSDWCSYLL